MRTFANIQRTFVALTVAYVCAMPCALADMTYMPSRAYAAEATYTTPAVDTTAQVQTDGSLRVLQQTIYEFTSSINVVQWNFTGLPTHAEYAISAVRMAAINTDGTIVGEWVELTEAPFEVEWRQIIEDAKGIIPDDIARRESSTPSAAQTAEDSTMDGNTPPDSQPAQNENAIDTIKLPQQNSWSFDKRRGILFTFFQQLYPRMIFEFDYTAADAIMAFDDVAELYWDYAPSRQDVLAQDITTTIQLPVPEGAAIQPNENVLAWGHGAPGEVTVNPDGTITYSVPQVANGQYAQAHVIFPAKWIANLDSEAKQLYSGTRRDDAIAEEEAWADTWSNQRINGLAVNIAVLAICMIALALAAILYLVFGREQKPGQPRISNTENAGASAGQETTWSVEKEDAATLGRLLRWNHASEDDFTATVRSLIDKGAIQVEYDPEASGTHDAEKGTAERSEREAQHMVEPVRLRVGTHAKSTTLTPVEKAAIRVMFGTLSEGYQSTSPSELRVFIKANPHVYADAMRDWQATVSEEVASSDVFDMRSFKLQRILASITIAFIVAALVSAFTLHNWLAFAAFAITAAALAFIANYIPRRTPKGIFIAEQLEQAQSV